MARKTWSGGLRLGIAIGAAIALLGVGIGVAVASIPSSGVISACYSTRTGSMRIVDYPSHGCVSGERLLRWNQAGAPATVTMSALDGTPCTLAPGSNATLHVDVNRSNGAVTFQCATLLRVASSVTLGKIHLDVPNSGIQAECLNAKACSLAVPLGTSNAEALLYNASAFRYTCPGAIQQGAYTDVTRTLYQAQCQGISVDHDQTVLVTGP